MMKTTFLSKALAFVSTISLFYASLIPAFAFQAGQQPMAELTVTGNAVGGEMPFVTVNGERAATGRSVPSPAQIAFPAQTDAPVTFGKAGRIELSPNTTIN